MNDEGGVRPSDVMHDVTPQEVTPVAGNRAFLTGAIPQLRNW
jgi:hypothetical protein